LKFEPDAEIGQKGTVCKDFEEDSMKPIIFILAVLLAVSLPAGNAFATGDIDPDTTAKNVMSTVVDQFSLSIQKAAKKQKKQDIVEDRKTFYDTLGTQAATAAPVADTQGYTQKFAEHFRAKPNHQQLKTWTTVMTQFENELLEVLADRSVSVDDRAQQVLALLKKYSKKGKDRKDALRPIDARHILDATADDLGPSGKDNEYGSGRIHALRAVRAAYEPEWTMSKGLKSVMQ